eukprot:COSAG01_NODE_4268_length_5196_cov_4.984304_4_plen_93_part_00
MEAHILPVFQAAFDLFMDHLNATLADMSEDPAPFHTHGAQWGGSGRFVLERLDVADGSKYAMLIYLIDRPVNRGWGGILFFFLYFFSLFAVD